LYPGYNQGYNQISDSSHSANKWHLTKYASLSAGYVFFAGGSTAGSSTAGGTSFLSAPFGLQLSRPLNNNLYAFAGISAAPVIFSANHFAANPVLNNSCPGFNQSNRYGLGLHAGVEAGLMYINDAKTFSISGSIGVDRSSYPVYPSNGRNTRKQ
jgi:hypothetical protein